MVTYYESLKWKVDLLQQADGNFFRITSKQSGLHTLVTESPEFNDQALDALWDVYLNADFNDHHENLRMWASDQWDGILGLHQISQPYACSPLTGNL